MKHLMKVNTGYDDIIVTPEDAATMLAILARSEVLVDGYSDEPKVSIPKWNISPVNPERLATARKNSEPEAEASTE